MAEEEVRVSITIISRTIELKLEEGKSKSFCQRRLHRLSFHTMFISLVLHMAESVLFLLLALPLKWWFPTLPESRVRLISGSRR